MKPLFKVLDNEYWLGAINFLMLFISTLLGAMAVGIAWMVTVYVLFLQYNFQKKFELFKQSGAVKDSQEYKNIIRYIAGPFFSMAYLPTVLLSTLIFFSIQNKPFIINHIISSNGWFFDLMKELLPTIEKHSAAASDQSDEIGKIYIINYSLYYTFLPIMTLANCVVAYWFFRIQAIERTISKISENNTNFFTYFAFLVFGVGFIFVIPHLFDMHTIVDGDVRTNPIYQYDVHEDNRLLLIGLPLISVVSISISIIYPIFLNLYIQLFKQIIRGKS